MNISVTENQAVMYDTVRVTRNPSPLACRLWYALHCAPRDPSWTKLTPPISQVEKKIGVSANSIRNIVRGARGGADPDTIHKIARGLGVDPTWLETGAGREPTLQVALPPGMWESDGADGDKHREFHPLELAIYILDASPNPPSTRAKARAWEEAQAGNMKEAYELVARTSWEWMHRLNQLDSDGGSKR